MASAAYLDQFDTASGFSGTAVPGTSAAAREEADKAILINGHSVVPKAINFTDIDAGDSLVEYDDLIAQLVGPVNTGDLMQETGFDELWNCPEKPEGLRLNMKAMRLVRNGLRPARDLLYPVRLIFTMMEWNKHAGRYEINKACPFNDGKWGKQETEVIKLLAKRRMGMRKKDGENSSQYNSLAMVLATLLKAPLKALKEVAAAPSAEEQKKYSKILSAAAALNTNAAAKSEHLTGPKARQLIWATLLGHSGRIMRPSMYGAWTALPAIHGDFTAIECLLTFLEQVMTTSRYFKWDGSYPEELGGTGPGTSNLYTEALRKLYRTGGGKFATAIASLRELANRITTTCNDLHAELARANSEEEIKTIVTKYRASQGDQASILAELEDIYSRAQGGIRLVGALSTVESERDANWNSVRDLAIKLLHERQSASEGGAQRQQGGGGKRGREGDGTTGGQRSRFPRLDA